MLKPLYSVLVWSTSSIVAILMSSLVACESGTGDGDGDFQDGNLIMCQSVIKRGKPQPARMIIARPSQEENKPWETEEMVSEAGSNAYHKAMMFQGAAGEPGLLTISANPPYLDLWRKEGESWKAKTLWTGTVGGKNRDRLRDVEVGDVDGDKKDEIVVVSHDKGIIMVFDEKEGGEFEMTEVFKAEEDTFVHEVEIGDVNGDGILEFFTTPSEPNTLNGEEQSGDVMMYRWDGSKYARSTVEHYATRHAKEILCCDFDKNGKPVLFVSLEAADASLDNTGGGAGPESSTLIRMYRWNGDEMTQEDVMPLPGDLCRFLCIGDTRGDGNSEVIASTKANGIFSVYRDGETWKKKLVAGPAKTGGFEHATCVFDRDGDGRAEIFAVSDDNNKLHRFFYDDTKKGYKAELLMNMPSGRNITWNIMPIPKGW